jgi:hypothetical protein
VAWVRYDQEFPRYYQGRRSTPGVYALYHQSKLIYIGHTQCVRSRIAAHRRAGIQFDECKLKVTRGRNKRFKLEARLIVRLRPPLNKYVPVRYGQTVGAS